MTETYTPKQQKENRKKWVEALRSGEYKQCKGHLYDGTGHCCLGVLGVVTGFKPKRIGGTYQIDGNPKVASYSVCQFVGLLENNGEYDDGCLTEHNDTGYDFNQIADIIEREPDGLFID